MAEVSGTIEKLAGVQQEFKENEKLIMGLQTFLNPENAKYMGDVFQQLVSMKQDLDANKQNLLAVKLLLANVNNPETKETLAKIAVLQKDIEKAKPLIVSINSNLTPEAISKLQDTPKLVEQLLSMQNTLKTNEQILKAAQSALNDGNIKLANDLINAIPTLSDGVNKLYEGSMKLNDGIVELADGSRELHEKLQDGADELNANLVNTSEEMGNFISEPVGMDVKPINPVKDYGTGFTPYFIPLSLWVGAIMMFFIITEKVDNDINASSASVVLGKFLSYSFIGVLQAVLASIVVLTLGLKPNNIVLYFVFNIFMSLVFIAIIQSLIFLLGQAGRLLSIVLLILQLTSCAGTFPLEVVPKFFKVLNPFMPFTYCVSALREIISGVNYSVLTKDITILALIMLVFLLISMLMKGHADKVQARIQERKQSIA
ncbi:hypothetical protein Q428_06440 [Fervidicella metallireducens AeB]|uniref:ABC-2 type transporter transmembrane domain-containing protein n=1 Tax=Fervidicella metallireducens AeB TaxID=1403537 RepID=A0A017RVT6_9CLOT|nr:YhgE/Pip family protein [Fervidicella metallireducens]EYE88721.1 hypothetical protein Q428_06440 [Fervidicella metallireducens AeB]